MRRSYYRNHSERLPEKRARYTRKLFQQVKELDLPLADYEPMAEGQIVYYRDSKEGEIYAVRCELYDDGKLIEQTKIKKCLGLSAKKLKRTLADWIGVFNARHSGKIHWREMDMLVKLCPLWIEESENSGQS